MGRIFSGRFGLVPMDAGNTGVLRFAVSGGRERRPKPGGPGPQRGPKRGFAPALLTYLPASSFGVFSSRIWFVCWGLASGRNREPSREPCREPTYDRFSRELRVPRHSLLVALSIRTRKTVRKTARKTDFRVVFRAWRTEVILDASGASLFVCDIVQSLWRLGPRPKRCWRLGQSASVPVPLPT